MKRTINHVVFLASLALASVSVAEAVELPKLTDRVRATLSNTEDFPRTYWIFLNADAVDNEPIHLTDKARARRARVDPANFLVDSLDFPISRDALDEIAATGVIIRRTSRWLRAVSVWVEADQIGQLAALPFVRKVDLVRTYRTSFPDDIGRLRPEHRPESASDFDYGPSLRQNRFTRANKLHQVGLSGAGVMISIFDTGFDIDHPAFNSASIVATYDFINEDTAVNEIECPQESYGYHQNYHGTMVFGILGAYTPGSLIGIAPGADYILAKTEMTCSGTEIRLEEDNWIAAAEWADSIGADIITSSLVYHDFTDGDDYSFADLDGNTALITIVADIAASRNMVVVNAAGNDRNKPWNHIGVPADGDSVLAVGALNPDSTLAGFSSPGPTADNRIKPDVVTLGVGVYSAYPEPARGYGHGSGTSYAAPLVAGGVALLLEHDPGLTARELLDTVRGTADRNNHPNNDYGYGLFDALRASGIALLDRIDPILVRVGESLDIAITTSGSYDVELVLSAFELPDGAEFTDMGNGTGVLAVTGSASNPRETRFGLIASTNILADTAYVTLETYGVSDRAIYAGPNPFTDAVRIIVSAAAGRLRSVSIFNTAAEKVWEKVNSSAVSADVVREWDMVLWDGRNQCGAAVAAGVYLVYVETDRQSAMLKLLKTD